MSRIPFAYPYSVPDRKDQPETILVGPDKKTPILQKVPRPFGFRPDRIRPESKNGQS